MKKITALILLCAVLLTGCGFAGESYQNYITAVLDCTYHNENEAYRSLTIATIPEADELYFDEVSALSESIQTYFGIKSDLISEEMKTGYQELAGKILKSTKYTVYEVIKSENGYDVTLMISPVGFWAQAEPEVRNYYEHDFMKRYSEAKTRTFADKLEEVYAFQVLKILNACADEMEYDSAVTYQFTVRSGENGISAETWQEIDRLLLNLNA